MQNSDYVLEGEIVNEEKNVTIITQAVSVINNFNKHSMMCVKKSFRGSTNFFVL